MDDRSDDNSDRSVDYCYQQGTDSPQYNIKSASAYGSGIVPTHSYSEAQTKRTDALRNDNSPEIARLDALIAGDTVHYMSPVSPLSARTEHEGDLDYYKHLYRLGQQVDGSQDDRKSYVSSTLVSCVYPDLQRTVAIIKPEAMVYEDVIVRAITDAGFCIIGSRTVHLTPEQVSEIHAQHYGSPTFPLMVVSMSIGPIRTLSLAGMNAISKWRDMIGVDGTLREEWFYPMSMRTRFGIHKSIPNMIKASENQTEADRENRYFYPETVLEPLLAEETKVSDYCGLYVNPTLLNGLAEVVRVKPIDPILYLAEWLLLNNPYQPRFPTKIAVIPT